MKERIVNKFDLIYERNIYYSVVNIIYFTKFFKNLKCENSFKSSRRSSRSQSSHSNSGSNVSFSNSNSLSKSGSKSFSNSSVESNETIKDAVTNDAFNFFRLLGNGNGNGNNDSQLYQNGNGAMVNSFSLPKDTKVKSDFKSHTSKRSHRSHRSNKSKVSEDSNLSKSKDSKHSFSYIASENGSCLNSPLNTLNTNSNLINRNVRPTMKPITHLKTLKRLEGPSKFLNTRFTIAPRYEENHNPNLFNNSKSDDSSNSK